MLRSIVIALLLLLATPVAANAASVGMSSTVLIPTPNKLVAGQTQYASYAITAGTTPAKVTVEWYRIINPRLSADFDSNRAVVVSEKSLGNSMTGNDSFTVPANAAPGHYGVLFRYYAQSANTSGTAGGMNTTSYSIPGNIEATANNSFYIEADACPNIAGAQPSLPDNHALVNGNCMPDVCPNIAGIQTEQPQGMIMENGNCVTPPVAPTPDPVIPQVATPTGTTGKPRLSITKKGSKKRVKQGQRVRFTIKVKNTGTAAATNVKVCDLMPAGMVYIGHTRRAMFERGGRVCWTVKRIGKGKTVTVGTLIAKITKPKGKVVNRACIMKGTTARTVKCAAATVRITARKPQPTGGVTG